MFRMTVHSVICNEVGGQHVVTVLTQAAVTSLPVGVLPAKVPCAGFHSATLPNLKPNEAGSDMHFSSFSFQQRILVPSAAMGVPCCCHNKLMQSRASSLTMCLSMETR